MREFIKIKKHEGSCGIEDSLVLISSIKSLNVHLNTYTNNTFINLQINCDSYNLIVPFESHNEALDYRDELEKQIEEYYEYKGIS